MPWELEPQWRALEWEIESQLPQLPWHQWMAEWERQRLEWDLAWNRELLEWETQWREWERSSLLGSLGHQQSRPEDSLYRAARQVLNSGDYRRAAHLFRALAEQYPRSRYAAESRYWQAFALYRAGTEDELRQALRVLEEQRVHHPDVASRGDAAVLLTRVNAALAARGDAEAARRVREGGAQGLATCDREDMEVRAEALSALVRADPGGAEAVLRRTLARRDDCSVPLRRRALLLLAPEAAERMLPTLVEIARNDPEASVRSDALSRIARLRSDAAIRALEGLLAASRDQRMLHAVVHALRGSEHAEARRLLRRLIEREDLPESVRGDAVRALAWPLALREGERVAEVEGRADTAVRSRFFPATGPASAVSEADAAYLRSLYGRVESRVVKTAILETLAHAPGSANDEWLRSIVRNPNEELRLRTTALGRLRRGNVSAEELIRLYDELPERPLRSALIRYLGARTEDAAADKLIAIARTATDPQLRREVINALSARRDERTTRLLLELIERQP